MRKRRRARAIRQRMPVTPADMRTTRLPMQHILIHTMDTRHTTIPAITGRTTERRSDSSLAAAITTTATTAATAIPDTATAVADLAEAAMAAAASAGPAAWGTAVPATAAAA